MRQLLFGLIVSLTSTIGYGQKQFNANQLDTMTKLHQFRCDSVKHKFESDMQLGELPMQLQFLEYRKNIDSLIIKSRIINKYSLEGIICNIYIATITNTLCNIESKIAQSDSNGNFTIKIKQEATKSIYFTSISYLDLELKIKELH